MHLILGLNGVIWVSAESTHLPEQADSSLTSEAQPITVRDVSRAERQAIARAANCIRALAKLYFFIHPASILSVYMVRPDSRHCTLTLVGMPADVVVPVGSFSIFGLLADMRKVSNE